jgi:type III secretion system YscQ/HrcQ family protein
MTISAFDLRRRPRVPASLVRAIRASLRWAASIPKRWEVSSPVVGAIAMTFEGFAVEPSGADDVGLPIAIGDVTLRADVDVNLAARVVDAALGGRGAFRSARSLGPAERGVLAAALGAAFDPIGWRLGTGGAPTRAEAGAQLQFRIETGVGSGVVRVTLSDAMPPPEGAGRELCANASRIALWGSLEIAATELAAGAIAALEPGDAVIFEGTRAPGFAAGGCWQAKLAIGDHPGAFATAVTLDAGGVVTIAGELEPRGPNLEADRRKESDMDGSGTTNATEVLRAIPVEVVAELARLKLRGEEVLGLVVGTVLTLPGRGNEVSLRVSGELFAQGELVDVDGELGVRVTRLVPASGRRQAE